MSVCVVLHVGTCTQNTGCLKILFENANLLLMHALIEFKCQRIKELTMPDNHQFRQIFLQHSIHLMNGNEGEIRKLYYQWYVVARDVPLLKLL